MKVKLRKVYISDTPDFPTPQNDNYVPGEENGAVSTPLGYEVEGEIKSIPTSNTSLTMLRTKRNGVEALGVFQTSVLRAVNKIADNRYCLWTANSIYELEVL